MRSSLGSLLAGMISAGLAMPPAHAMQAAAIAMPLCGGGIVLVGGRPDSVPAEQQGACHAICATRRDDDDD